MNPEVAGVVLAGGRSRRFGRDKLAEPYEGRPLLHHPVSVLSELCDRVVVVIAPGEREPSIPPGLEVAFARDAVRDRGPLGGVAAGLAHSEPSSWAVLVGGDMPRLHVDVLRVMVRAARETGAAAVALADAGDARPLPSVVRVRPAAETAATLLADGHGRLRDLLAALETVVVDEPTWTALDPERGTLLDVDEPADLGR